MRLGLGLGLPFSGGGGAFSPLSLAPTAYWPLNDGSGETAVDVSGNGYDLTLVSAPTWIAGHIGGALNFDGGTEYGEATAAGLLAALAGSSEFTIAFWARDAAYAGNQVAVCIRNGTQAGDALLLYPYDDNAGNGFRIFYTGDATLIDQNTGAAPVDEWNHYIFMSRSATDHEAFVNGVSVGTSSTSKTLPDPLSHVEIGAWSPGGQLFSGDIDEPIIVDRALTADEIAALFAWAG